MKLKYLIFLSMIPMLLVGCKSSDRGKVCIDYYQSKQDSTITVIADSEGVTWQLREYSLLKPIEVNLLGDACKKRSLVTKKADFLKNLLLWLNYDRASQWINCSNCIFQPSEEYWGQDGHYEYGVLVYNPSGQKILSIDGSGTRTSRIPHSCDSLAK